MVVVAVVAVVAIEAAAREKSGRISASSCGVRWMVGKQSAGACGPSAFSTMIAAPHALAATSPAAIVAPVAIVVPVADKIGAAVAAEVAALLPSLPTRPLPRQIPQIRS